MPIASTKAGCGNQAASVLCSSNSVQHIEKAEGAESLAFVIVTPRLLNGALAVPGTLKVPRPDFPAGMADWAPGVQRPVFAIDLLPVNEERPLPAAATAAKSDTEVLGVFVNSLENSADGHVIANDAAAVPSAVCEEEFGIGIYHLSLAPEYREIVTIHLQQVGRGQQRVHGQLLHALAHNLGMGSVNGPVVFQIETGKDAYGAVDHVGFNRLIPRRDFRPGDVKCENERVIIGLGHDRLGTGPHHRNDTGVGEPGRHQKIVRVVVAVPDVENDFVCHTGNACEIKTRRAGKSIGVNKNSISKIDFWNLPVFLT